MTEETCRERILSEEVEIVSFDIFDTLLLRPFFAPADLFDFLDPFVTEFLGARDSVDFKTYRKEAEQMARQRFASRGEDVTLDEVYECLGEMLELPQNRAEIIKSREIRMELRFCRPRNFARKLFDLAKSAGKRVVIASDMYLPQSVVEELLEKNGCTGYEKLYLSSSLRRTKATGHLYEYMAEDLGADPGSILHIGDNETADVRRAKSRGLQAIHFPKCRDLLMNAVSGRYSGEVFQKAYGESFLNRFGVLRDFLGIRAMLAMVANRLFDNPFRSFRRDSDFDGDAELLGYGAIGMHLFALADWLHRETGEEGVDNLCFMARDGHLPMRAFEMLKPCYGGVFPSLRYCHFNRASTLPLRIAGEPDWWQISRGITVTAKSPRDVVEWFSPFLSEEKKERAKERCEEAGFPYGVKFASFGRWNEFLRFFKGEFYSPEAFADYRREMKAALQPILGGKTATFDIGYHYRVEDTLKGLGFDITPYCVHIIDDLACRRAGKDGFRPHVFYGYSPVICGMVREMLISEIAPGCEKIAIRGGEAMPVEQESDTGEREILHLLQESALAFVRDMADTFGKDIEHLYYQREDACLGLDYFLLHPKTAELELFSGIYDDDFVQSKRFDIVQFWQYQIRQLANGGLRHGDDLRFRFPRETVPEGTRLVLYGGGEVGKTFLRQAKEMAGIRIVALCDREPELTGIREEVLITPTQLAGMDPKDYDIVLIAIEREQIAEDIRKNLEELGVPEERILWKDPARKTSERYEVA